MLLCTLSPPPASLSQVLYGLESVGLSGTPSAFEKPLLLTWLMFLAMSAAMPLHFINEWNERRRSGGVSITTATTDGTSWRTMLLLLVPTGFDLAATAFAAAGLMFTTVSVYQVGTEGSVNEADLP